MKVFGSTMLAQPPSFRAHAMTLSLDNNSILQQNGPKQPWAIEPAQYSHNGLWRVETAPKSSNGLWSIKPPSSTNAPKCNQADAFEAWLHSPHNNHRGSATKDRRKTAAILVADASGDTDGPSSMYTSLADKLGSLRHGMPVLRMGNRVPACKESCVADVLAAMEYLQQRFAVSRFVLVGWNHGSAPIIAVGGLDDRVVGCGMIASRTADSDLVERIAKKSLPLLLLHGASNEVIPPSCSEELLEHYQRHAKEDMGFLKLFDGDDHVLTKNAAKAEAMLCAFVTKCAGTEYPDDEATRKKRLLCTRREKVSLIVGAGRVGEE